MNDIPIGAAVGSATVVALVAACLLARWIGRLRTLRAADRVARSLSSEQALAQVSPLLREKLERYRLAKLRVHLGSASPVHAAAEELVRENRLFNLERR